MGTISVNRLGGLSLIVGPILAVIMYLIQPGGGLVGGNVDPADSDAAIAALMANADMAGVSYSLVSLGLIILLYGVNALVGSLKGGNGEALSQYGSLFLLLATVGWVTGSALSLIIAGGNAGAAADAVYAVGLGINLLASAICAVAILILSLAIFSSGDFNKPFALLVAAVSAVLLVSSIMAGNDLSLLQTTNMIGGVGYVVTTIWTITIGLSLMKKG